MYFNSSSKVSLPVHGDGIFVSNVFIGRVLVNLVLVKLSTVVTIEPIIVHHNLVISRITSLGQLGNSQRKYSPTVTYVPRKVHWFSRLVRTKCEGLGRVVVGLRSNVLHSTGLLIRNVWVHPFY